MAKRVPPLNVKQLDHWKPHPVRTLELIDGFVPGLRVRLSPRNEMSWSLSVRVHGVHRRIAIGKNLKLAEARRRAEQMRQQIAEGSDPTAERKALDARHLNAAKGFGTLGTVIKSYYENGPGKDLLRGLEAREMVERVLKDHLERPALDVTTAQLQLTIDAYPSKSSARHCVIYFRPLARWAAKRGLMAKGDTLETPRQPPIEQRVLTHAEVKLLWGKLGWSRHDAAARFMLLTGARREEVCGATWGEIKDGFWVLPGRRRKNPRALHRVQEDHVVPLPRQALELLKRQGKGKPEDLVFVGQRNGRLDNWPRWTNWVRKRVRFDVTPHSLRRTCATLAGDLGVAPHVVSALLGHRAIGGSLLSGYNQSRYTREVAIALQQVGDMLDSLVAGRDNIVTLRVTT